MFSRLALRTVTSSVRKPFGLNAIPVRTAFWDRFSPFSNSNAPPEVTVEQVHLIPQIFHITLDVRDIDERENGQHIADDFNMPLRYLPDKLDEISVQMKGCIVLVYCQAGVRSKLAAKLLREVGVEAWNLKGGYSAYQQFKAAEADGTLEYTQTREDAIEHMRVQAQVGHKMELINNKK